MEGCLGKGVSWRDPPLATIPGRPFYSRHLGLDGRLHMWGHGAIRAPSIACGCAAYCSGDLLSNPRSTLPPLIMFKESQTSSNFICRSHRR